MLAESDWIILRDLERFCALDLTARAELSGRVLHALGGSWHTGAYPDSRPLDALPLVHRATKQAFLLVPGGQFEMGLSDADIAAFNSEVGDAKVTQEILSRYQKITRPVRSVVVAPFVIAQRGLSNKDANRISKGRYKYDTFQRAEALELASMAGFRLPSEAEFEWLLRDGGRFSFSLDCVTRVRKKSEPRSRFGLEGLIYEQWLADDWHTTYEGAPASSSPWLGGSARGVYRGGLLLSAVQSDSEYLFGLAALRFPGPRPKNGQGDDSDAISDLTGIEEEVCPDAIVRPAAQLSELLAGGLGSRAK